MLIDNTNKIIFIHIPKTAGSSINSLLLSSNFELIFPSVYSSHNKKHIILRLNKHKYPDYIIVEKSFSEIKRQSAKMNQSYPNRFSLIRRTELEPITSCPQSHFKYSPPI